MRAGVRLGRQGMWGTQCCPAARRGRFPAKAVRRPLVRFFATSLAAHGEPAEVIPHGPVVELARPPTSATSSSPTGNAIPEQVLLRFGILLLRGPLRDHCAVGRNVDVRDPYRG